MSNRSINVASRVVAIVVGALLTMAFLLLVQRSEVQVPMDALGPDLPAQQSRTARL